MMRKEENPIRREINLWVMSTSYAEFAEAIERRVIGQPNVNLVAANIYNYLRNVGLNRPTDNNMLLAAPSGSGKTETYRAIREYFASELPCLPVYSFDVSSLTPSGYKGPEPYDICTPFFDAGFTDAVGICFLDEFDKKLTPSPSTAGDFNALAQYCMLTIIEDGIIKDKFERTIKTTDIMFVGLGSFDRFRKQRETLPKVVGFGNSMATNPIHHYAPLSKDDMVKSGGSYELIGRFPVIVNYDRLSSIHVLQIIERETFKTEFSFSCEIILTENMMKVLLDAANGMFGCRTLSSMIRNATLIAYSNAMKEKLNDKQLSITINSPDEASFVWRDYTEEEKLEWESFLRAVFPKRLESQAPDSENCHETV